MPLIKGKRHPFEGNMVLRKAFKKCIDIAIIRFDHTKSRRFKFVEIANVYKISGYLFI